MNPVPGCYLNRYLFLPQSVPPGLRAQCVRALKAEAALVERRRYLESIPGAMPLVQEVDRRLADLRDGARILDEEIPEAALQLADRDYEEWRD